MRPVLRIVCLNSCKSPKDTHPGLSDMTSLPWFIAAIDIFALSLGIAEVKITCIFGSSSKLRGSENRLAFGKRFVKPASVLGEPSVYQPASSALAQPKTEPEYIHAYDRYQ